MGEKILLHLDQGGEGLDPLAKEAAQSLKVKQAGRRRIFFRLARVGPCFRCDLSRTFPYRFWNFRARRTSSRLTLGDQTSHEFFDLFGPAFSFNETKKIATLRKAKQLKRLPHPLGANLIANPRAQSQLDNLQRWRQRSRTKVERIQNSPLVLAILKRVERA
jgi:hypothetical protein